MPNGQIRQNIKCSGATVHTMKSSYPRYGSSTESLVQNLNAHDCELLEGFLSYCAMTAGPNRLSKYRRYVLHFRDIVEKPLDEITKEEAIAFWGLIHSAPYEEHTKIAIRRSVKRFLKWHYRDLDMIEVLRVPANYLVNNKRVNKAALLSPDELRQMLHGAERLRDKALLTLLYETAARPQEVRELRWRDVKWEAEEVHLYSRKTKRDRTLPVKESLKHLKRWKAEWVYPDPQEADFIFPSLLRARSDRTKPISIAYINRVIKTLARRAGVPRPVNTYLLRHTRLTEIRRLGIQGVEFNKFAGHTPGSKQEAVYVHLDNEDMKRSVLEKVYKISDEEKKAEKYEDRITLLEQQLENVLAFLKDSRQLISAAEQDLATLS